VQKIKQTAQFLLLSRCSVSRYIINFFFWEASNIQGRSVNCNRLYRKIWQNEFALKQSAR